MVEYFDMIDLFLVMSVFPGFSGQSFISDVLTKVSEAARIREEKSLDFAIEIDGGMNAETAPLAREAGAEILVAGSAVYGSSDYEATIDRLRGESSK